MTKEQLAAYALLGAEHKRLQEERLEKIKSLLKTLSDDEYKQLLELAKASGDEQMQRDLPIWRSMVND